MFRSQIPIDLKTNNNEFKNISSSLCNTVGQRQSIETYELSKKEFLKINSLNGESKLLMDEIATLTQNTKSNVKEPEYHPSDESDNDLAENDNPEESLEAEDPLFMIYKRNMIDDQSQILRYCFSKNSTPLYFSSRFIFSPKTNLKCQLCGSEKYFEFQINNSLLNLCPEIMELDLGIVAFYTCSKSCNSKVVGELIEESVFVQNELNVLNVEPDQYQKFKEEEFMAKELISKHMIPPTLKVQKSVPKPKVLKSEDFDEDDWK